MVLAFSVLALTVFMYLWVSSPIMSKALRNWIGFSFPVFLIVVFVVQVDVLSRPKPTNLEFMKSGETMILSSRVVPDHAIYLWLLFKGEPEPRYYSIPWSPETARKLQEAIKQAGKNGRVMMSLPYQQSWGADSPFHPAPQPKLPDKMGIEPPPEAPKRGA